jgi:hypothetical protein
MTDAQTTNDALALVTRSCAYATALRAIPPAKTPLTAARRPVDCQVLVCLLPARNRTGRKASASARAALPRSP